ncbi:hypothetical protein BX600DRAFT_467918 [Xylariales sp. PMI_506]|nr:hypothetical protein BX600DRAFT_467918 [Xylariales sp. PMI_506]
MENLSPEQVDTLRHWSSFGQRGITPSRRILPWEWRNEPFVCPVRTPWHIPVEPHQLPLLILGFLPRIAGDGGIDPSIFTVGDTIRSHIFMSASQRNDVSASEDKWFIYADGPGGLDGELRMHMFRSWTGLKQIELVIDAGFDGYGKEGNGAAIKEIIWESDLEAKWKDADAETYKGVAREVCQWVLNVRLGTEDTMMDGLLKRLQAPERNQEVIEPNAAT